MPTKYRRHAIAETPPIHDALEALRREQGRDRLDLAELLLLGAREKLAQLRSRDSRRRELRQELAEMVLACQIPVDPEAAMEVRRSGWARA